VAGIVRAEQSIGEEARRRQYSIALKRMYTKPLLEGIAHLVPMPAQRDSALLALQRAGEAGVEVLLDLLVAAPTIDERRGVFQALTGMKEGTEQLIHMLGHHQWFVVRNVAELVGELGLEEAVPALARQLDHEDERVRKAVALALAKTGSRSAAEPLRRALKDKSPEVRIQAAVGVGGRKASALAMPLVVAMGEEEDEAVEQELMLALGRIGSPDAVQALIKFAQPGGKLFGRKPTGLRVTAVEALRLAATPAAIGTLEGLGADSDKQVRAAAQAAVRDLKSK
jgi:HEAT repeat protein